MSGWTVMAEGDRIWKQMMKGGKSACYSQSQGSGKIRDVRWESEETLEQSRTESFITCSVWKFGKCHRQPFLACTKVHIICSKYLKAIIAATEMSVPRGLIRCDVCCSCLNLLFSVKMCDIYRSESCFFKSTFSIFSLLWRSFSLTFISHTLSFRPPSWLPCMSTEQVEV